MNSKTTGIWFLVAAVLALFIFAFQHFLRPVIAGPSLVLPQLNPGLVASIQVIPADAPEISVVRTNGGWYLNKPLFYPGQTAAIESLLDSLQKLVPAPRLTAAEMPKDAETEFGFNKALTLVVEEKNARWQILVGNRTAPGNQVYLRVEGIDGAFVVDADWLKWIPRTVTDWRDTSLVDTLDNNFDSIVLTNNLQGLAIELRRDPTNHLWRMLRPLSARADTEHINMMLQQLQNARVSKFITDDPKAELSTYGLRPAEMDLWLGNQTNLLTGLHFGQSVPDEAAQIFARRAEWDAVVETAKDPLAPWFGAVNSFRDTNLFELNSFPTEIELRFAGTNDNFVLRWRGTNNWAIVGAKYPADAGSSVKFIKDLLNLHVAEFVKDVVTPADWATYGLDHPSEQIILRATAGDTNPLVQLDFGNSVSNKIFVRRGDEPFIYAITWPDFRQLPDRAWELRDHHIWDFSTNDVAKVTVHQNGKTRELIRNGINEWSLAVGSNGSIEGAEIEQAVQQLSQLRARDWLGVNLTDPEQLGFMPGNLEITVELKDGKKFTVDFGPAINNSQGVAQTATAMVTLDGERWAFVMSPEIYLFVSTYLTIPPNVP